MATCACRSGLEESECHETLASFIYRSPMDPGVLDAGSWTDAQRDNAARAMRKLGTNAQVRGNEMHIASVSMGWLVSLSPVAGPEGWLATGRQSLAARSKWLSRRSSGIEGLDQAIATATGAARRWFDDAQPTLDIQNFDTFLHHLEHLALSDAATDLELATAQFLEWFPAGAIDIVSSPEHCAQRQMYTYTLGASRAVPPDELLGAQAAGHDFPPPLYPVDVLEALLERRKPSQREGHVIKRPDSSLVFAFSGFVELPPVEYRGVYRPRGITRSQLDSTALGPDGETAVTVTRVGFRADARRQYLVAALRKTQSMLALLLDPLRFRSHDAIDPLSQSTALRTVQRLVELTQLVATIAEPAPRRELMISLMDLYQSFDVSALPSARALKAGRTWLPAASQEVENERVDELVEQLISEIWAGVITGKRGDELTLPDGRSLAKKSYAEQFLQSFRNALTHGYHTRQQREAMESVMAVHNGQYPTVMAEFAIPLLEAFIGNAEHWIRRFAERPHDDEDPSAI